MTKVRRASALLLVVAAVSTYGVATPSLSEHKSSRSLWPSGGPVPGYQNYYQEVALLRPKFKSREQVGLDRFSVGRAESDTSQTRHLDWLDSSSGEPESATQEGFFDNVFGEDDVEDDIETKSDNELRDHYKKKYTKSHKIIYPLLLAYKLKFFTMIPLLIGSLILLVGTTGLAGFFFALFAAAAGIPSKAHHH